jgi:hypothetical protein
LPSGCLPPSWSEVEWSVSSEARLLVVCSSCPCSCSVISFLVNYRWWHGGMQNSE